MTKADMTTAALYARLVDRLRHAQRFSEAATLMTKDALELLEVDGLEADLLAATEHEGGEGR
jgi:hypothetical protein